MKEKKFGALVKEHFGEILIPYGFSCKQSHYSTFYRKKSEDIFHFIIADLSMRGEWYDISVFASSPKIDPNFRTHFPDDLGIPSDALSYLHPITGVGCDQKMFRCRTEEGFLRGFNKEVKQTLIEKALPFLDQITDLESLLPHIKHDSFMGFALWELGEREEARRFLQESIARYSEIDDLKVKNYVQAAEALLSKS